jgi:type IV pilus assembly PilO-like protein
MKEIPTQKKRQLKVTIEKFYSNPVARVSFELILTIGTVLFFALFAIRPTLLTMSDLIKEIDDKESLDEEMKKKVAALSSAQIEYQILGDRTQVLDMAIPDSPQLIDTLKMIEKIAGEQTVVINSLNLEEIPSELKEELDVLKMKRQTLQIKIDLIGDYQSIRKFVEGLMDVRRTLVVESVIFDVRETRGVKSLSARITLNAPYFANERSKTSAR